MYILVRSSTDFLDKWISMNQKQNCSLLKPLIDVLVSFFFFEWNTFQVIFCAFLPILFYCIMIFFLRRCGRCLLQNSDRIWNQRKFAQVCYHNFSKISKRETSLFYFNIELSMPLNNLGCNCNTFQCWTSTSKNFSVIWLSRHWPDVLLCFPSRIKYLMIGFMF